MKKTLLIFVSVIALSACGTSQSEKPVTSMNPRLKTSAIDRAMESALNKAEAAGNKQEILATLAQVHKRNLGDPIVATRYARALREDDQVNEAIRTLVPFVTPPNDNIDAITEMSMVQLSAADYAEAEKYAQNAIEMNDKNARAYLALGTALDAQQKHEAAETAFRNGVKNWKGDASPILNNLALNLASQGHLKEALSLLEKAIKESPNRLELERNRRIISTLLETTNEPAPAPTVKPSVKPTVKPTV